MESLNIANPNKLWFTSDPHYYHENIISYCDRPFFDVTEMNNWLIQNWNAVVDLGDQVFVDGDFAFTSNIEKIADLVSKLNGKIHLIMGNHDYQNRFQREAISSLFETVSDNALLHVEDEEIGGIQKIFLSHYAMLMWPESHRGSWQLFGHVHSGPKSTASELPLLKNIKPTQYDVGVDNNDFTPISYQKVKTIITKQCLNNKAPLDK